MRPDRLPGEMLQRFLKRLHVAAGLALRHALRDGIEGQRRGPENLQQCVRRRGPMRIPPDSPV